MRGFVQVYTGEGKGKTTAALGLALRAAGAGHRVLIVQFMKGTPSSEDQALAWLGDRIVLRRCGLRSFVRAEPSAEDVARAQAGLQLARESMCSGEFAVVVLDEANVAVAHGLFALEDLLALIAEKPAEVELVVTGRGAHPEVIARADLVTEMRAVKHYFSRGIPARVGIEK